MSSFVRTITSSARTRPETPQFRATNHLKVDAYVSDIALAADPYFVRYGAIEIHRRGVIEFSSTRGGEFLQSQTTVVPMSGKTIRRDEAIEVYVWNPLSEDRVSITVSLKTDEEHIPAGAPPAPADIEQINRLTSTHAAAPGDTSDLAKWAAIAASFLDNYGDSVAPAYRDLLTALTRGFDLDDLMSEPMNLDMLLAADPPTGTALAAANDVNARFKALNETLPVPGARDPAVLFPQKVYVDEDHARLIDLAGNRSMIITMSASTVPSVARLNGPTMNLPNPADASVGANIPLSFTGHTSRRQQGHRYITITSATMADNLAPPAYWYFYDTNGTEGQDKTIRFTPPFRTRAINNEYGYRAPGTSQYNVYQVDAWAQWLYVVWGSSSPTDFSGATRRPTTKSHHTYTAAGVSERYVGIAAFRHIYIERYFRYQTPTVAIFTPLPDGIIRLPGSRLPLPGDFDAPVNVLATGGSASVRFEVKGPEGAWSELIPARAIARGETTVAQIGPATGQVLPSSQQLFRARMDVEGAVETSVSIILAS